MNLVRCSNGHFYDADKSAQCPHCAAAGGAVPGGMPMGNQGFGAPNMMNQGFSSTSEETVAYETGSAGEYGYTTDDTDAGQNINNAFNPQQQPQENFARPVTPQPQKFQPEEDDSVTIRWTEGMNKEPVVGWLVGLNGEVAGESFEIRTGKNFIGRGDDMDVVIKGDKRISRNKHAIILYEPKNKLFMVQPGESRELFYLNGNVVLNTEKIGAYDKLYIGETELMFIPLCGDNFSWDEI